MNIKYKSIALALACSLGFSSCASFLDVAPEEEVEYKDTYADRQAGENFLYSCYGYLPNPFGTSASLDLLTGDEVVTAFEHETFAQFPKGKYSASSPGISYWQDLYSGIRRCYEFEKVIDELPAETTSVEEKEEYHAHVDYLLGYYYFLLMRCYGPVSLVTKPYDVTTPGSDFPARSTYDETIDFIVKHLDLAINGRPIKGGNGLKKITSGLPVRQEDQNRYGLGTKVAAKALKAKVLLYAASPLFSGKDRIEILDKNKKDLMASKVSPQKRWENAYKAIDEAIKYAEANGHALYTKDNFRIGDNDANQLPAQGKVRLMRTWIMDWIDGPNPEVLLADTRTANMYGLQGKSGPYGKSNYPYNGVSPTWTMLNRFYTNKGLPIKEDPNWADLTESQLLEIVTVDALHKDQAEEGRKTMRFNLDRENRYYAWVGFQGGFYELKTTDKDGNYTPISGNSGSFKANKSANKYTVVLNFLVGGDQGRNGRNNDYSPGGFLNKKGVSPSTVFKKGGLDIKDPYPWPIIRLADLYLARAEAAVELNKLDEAIKDLDVIRVRAGVPTVKLAWKKAKHPTLDQARLRQIVRDERGIELYLECQNFWDLRRWKIADKYFNHKVWGMNIQAKDINAFAQLKEIPFDRGFDKNRNYLLPIPLGEVQRNPNLVQNPGY